MKHKIRVKNINKIQKFNKIYFLNALQQKMGEYCKTCLGHF